MPPGDCPEAVADIDAMEQRVSLVQVVAGAPIQVPVVVVCQWQRRASVCNRLAVDLPAGARMAEQLSACTVQGDGADNASKVHDAGDPD